MHLTAVWISFCSLPTGMRMIRILFTFSNIDEAWEQKSKFCSYLTYTSVIYGLPYDNSLFIISENDFMVKQSLQK